MSIIDVVIAYSFIRDMTVPFEKTKAYQYGIINADGKILKKRKELSSNQRHAYPSILTVLAWNIKRLLSKIAIGKSTLGSFISALYLLREEIRRKGDLNDDQKLNSEFIGLIESALYSSDRERMINDAFESTLVPVKLSKGRYHIFDEEVSVKEDLLPMEYLMGVPLYECFHEGKKLVFSPHDLNEMTVPVNNVGSGMVKGIAPGEDPPIRVKKKKIYELMGRYTVFEVSPQEFEKCSCAKRKYEKWSKYFEEDSETGNEIRRYSFNNPEKGIILRNSETGQTMMFRRRWSDQRLAHNKKARLLVQQKEQNKVYTIWTR